MKRIATVIVAAGTALALSASTAQAQAYFGVGAGATIPTGDLADAVGTGWHAIANVGYDMPSGLGLRGDFLYGQQSFDANSDVKLKLAGFYGNVTYGFGGAGAVKPYLIGTIGGTNSKASGGPIDGESSTDLTYGAGAGIKFGNMSGATFYVEGRYLIVNGDGDDSKFIPVSAGIRFGF
jgi:hypothetical protein